MTEPMTPERLAEIEQRRASGRIINTVERDLIAEVRRLQAAVERVRALHHRVEVGVIMGDCAREECDHETPCPEVPFAVCDACYSIADQIDPYLYERGGVEVVAWPCPTLRALSGDEQ